MYGAGNTRIVFTNDGKPKQLREELVKNQTRGNEGMGGCNARSPLGKALPLIKLYHRSSWPSWPTHPVHNSAVDRDVPACAAGAYKLVDLVVDDAFSPRKGVASKGAFLVGSVQIINTRNSNAGAGSCTDNVVMYEMLVSKVHRVVWDTLLIHNQLGRVETENMRTWRKWRNDSARSAQANDTQKLTPNFVRLQPIEMLQDRASRANKFPNEPSPWDEHDKIS